MVLTDIVGIQYPMCPFTAPFACLYMDWVTQFEQTRKNPSDLFFIDNSAPLIDRVVSPF